MYLLDIPTWIQAGTGIAALLLSVITLFQSKKIKELVDITRELASHTEEMRLQNDILRKTFDLQDRLTLEDRIPLFEPFNFESSPSLTGYSIKLKNAGKKKAFKLKSYSKNENSFKISILNDQSVCGKEELVTFIVSYVGDDRFNDYENLPFAFELIYNDNRNQVFRQTVYQEIPQGSYFVSLPET